MAKRGPKPKPAALRLAGAAGKAAVVPRAAERPDCPDHLDSIAREHWETLVPLLADAGLLSRVDGDALAIYCALYSRWVRANEEIAGEMTVFTDKGSLKVSPYVQIASAAERDMARMLAEFGCTPSSRSRVQMTAEGPKDAFAEFLAKRKA